MLTADDAWTSKSMRLPFDPRNPRATPRFGVQDDTPHQVMVRPSGYWWRRLAFTPRHRLPGSAVENSSERTRCIANRPASVILDAFLHDGDEASLTRGIASGRARRGMRPILPRRLLGSARPHAAERLNEGVSAEYMLTEYATLRSSVLRVLGWWSALTSYGRERERTLAALDLFSARGALDRRGRSPSPAAPAGSLDVDDR